MNDRLTTDDLGLPSAAVRGLRRWGHPFLLILNDAVIAMERASGGRDAANGSILRKRVDPRDLLPSILYTALHTAQTYEIPLVAAEPVEAVTAPTPRDELELILLDLIEEVSTARYSGQELVIDGRITLKAGCLPHTVERIQALFNRDLPAARPADTRVLLLSTQVRQLEAKLAEAGAAP